MDIDQEKFWEETGAAFSATIRLAIHETSEALLLQKMPPTLRAELEGQLAWLKDYLDQENRRAVGLESRSECRGPPGPRERIMN